MGETDPKGSVSFVFLFITTKFLKLKPYLCSL